MKNQLRTRNYKILASSLHNVKSNRWSLCLGFDLVFPPFFLFFVCNLCLVHLQPCIPQIGCLESCHAYIDLFIAHSVLVGLYNNMLFIHPNHSKSFDPFLDQIFWFPPTTFPFILFSFKIENPFNSNNVITLNKIFFAIQIKLKVFKMRAHQIYSVVITVCYESQLILTWIFQVCKTYKRETKLFYNFTNPQYASAHANDARCTHWR